LTVHVWTREGQYVGYVMTQPGWKLDVVADDEAHRERVKAALLSVKGDGSDFIEVRATGMWRRSLEFPEPRWVAVASVLPPAGYRVHVIMDAEDSG